MYHVVFIQELISRLIRKDSRISVMYNIWRENKLFVERHLEYRICIRSTGRIFKIISCNYYTGMKCVVNHVNYDG